MIPSDLPLHASAYVRQLFADADNKALHFHNYEHTERVVQHVVEIAQKEGVTPEELEILLTAAWFHDVGHLNGDMQDHEQRSVEAMRRFMAEQGVDDDFFVQRVSDCIMSTRWPQAPPDKLGEIMCDADVYHFGTPRFRKTNKRVRKELKARGYPAMANNWSLRSLRMLQSQHFFTPYSRQQLEAGKAENIRWLERKVARKQGKKIEAEAPAKNDGAKPEVSTASEASSSQTVVEPKVASKTDRNLLTRGVQTMLRLGSSNHIELSRIADGKANILISVNSIIISVILSFLVARLDADPYLLIPTMLFLTSSVVTVVLAILATRPKLTEGTFTRESIQRREINLLFFGNFYKSTLDEYRWGMSEMMSDRDYLYDTLVKDIYFLGVVLGKKYRLLRWAYNVFMIGLVVAVLSFTIAVIVSTPAGHTTVINASGSPL
jgi:predicted metal-dependent HD superfamily phosphohydrolase